MNTLNLSIDLTGEKERLKSQFEYEAKATAKRLIERHFNDGRYGIKPEKGLGYQEIEAKLDEWFGTEKMHKRIETIFEQEFEKIFMQAMTKAIEHKVNKMVFTSRDERLKAISSFSSPGFYDRAAEANPKKQNSSLTGSSFNSEISHLSKERNESHNTFDPHAR